MKKTFTWNDTTFKFSATNANDLDRFKHEMNRISERMELLIPEGKEELSTDEVRQACSYIDDMFDGIFGDGSAEKMFGGEPDLDEHMKAFYKVIKVKEQQEKNYDMFQNKLKGAALKADSKQKGKKK